VGKVFLCLLAAIGCSIATGLTGFAPFLIAGFVFYGLTFVFFIIAVINLFKSFVYTHRRYRQAVDDERIQKMYDKFNKG